jgi:hypothetical protein
MISVSTDWISVLKLSKSDLNLAEYHSWVRRHHHQGISYHISPNSLASCICLCLHLQLISNNLNLSTNQFNSYDVSGNSFAQSGLKISLHEILFTEFNHLVVWLIGLCHSTSPEATISNHSFSAISNAVFIMNPWQSIHGFMFFQYPYFGSFTISRCGAEISAILILIQLLFASFSAFSLPKNGVQKVSAVQSIH